MADTSGGLINTLVKRAAEHVWLRVLAALVVLGLMPAGHAIGTVLEGMSHGSSLPATHPVRILDAFGRPVDLHVQVDGRDAPMRPDGRFEVLVASSHRVKAWERRSHALICLRANGCRDYVLELPMNEPSEVIIQADMTGDL